jgi:CDP-diacylglycerol---glycerol-3-phosphate 3-phosphatidyltransferase
VSAADIVATLRALSTVPIAWAILAGLRDVALIVFLAAALTDAVDGYLARRLRSLSPRGDFLDPIADKVLVVGTLLALTVVGTGWPVTVVTILVALREGLVTVLRARALARGIGLPADVTAKAKTVLEMVGVALIIVDGRPWAVLGAGLVGVAFLIGLATLPRYFTPRLA